MTWEFQIEYNPYAYDWPWSAVRHGDPSPWNHTGYGATPWDALRRAIDGLIITGRLNRPN